LIQARSGVGQEQPFAVAVQIGQNQSNGVARHTAGAYRKTFNGTTMTTDEIRSILQEYNKGPLSKLMSAAERGNVKLMRTAIDDGASVHERDPLWNRTALHAAASTGGGKAVEYLLSVGAPLNVLDGNQMTPLMNACSAGKKKGSASAIALLDSGADARYKREEDGMDAIKFAFWGNCSPDVLQKLLDAGAEPPEPDFRVVRLV
jgi:ankyrin repeat protein